MAGISIPQLLIIAALVVLLFGTKKLRNLGSDLGAAIKGFKKSMSDDESKSIENSDNQLSNQADNKSVDDKPEHK